MSLLVELLKNLAVTVTVEGAVIWLVQRDRRFVYYSFLCNLLTNPAANLLALLSMIWLGAGAYYPAVAVLECLVVAAEAAVYRTLGNTSKRRALWLSLLLNALSFLIGLLLNLLLAG